MYIYKIYSHRLTDILLKTHPFVDAHRIEGKSGRYGTFQRFTVNSF